METLQVAQLWQRDRAKLETFSMNVQRYSQIARNWIFEPPVEAYIKGNICALSEIFNTKKPCSRVYSIELEFYSQKRQIRFLSHPSGELGVTYALHL